jgi:hypothetical protein
MALIVDGASKIQAAGSTWQQVFNYQNGNSGAAPIIETTHGKRAIHIVRTSGDGVNTQFSDGTNIRTQVGGLYELSGAVHYFNNYANKEIWYGGRMGAWGNWSTAGFVDHFNWASSTLTAGEFTPFSLGQGPADVYQLATAYGSTNSHYGTTSYHDNVLLATTLFGGPLDSSSRGDWFDWMVGCFWSTDWNTGWIELYTKPITSSLWQQWTFPVGTVGTNVYGNVLRYIQRTLGDASGDHNNRFGFQSDVAFTGDTALNAIFVATVNSDGSGGKQDIINAITGLDGSTGGTTDTALTQDDPVTEAQNPATAGDGLYMRSTVAGAIEEHSLTSNGLSTGQMYSSAKLWIYSRTTGGLGCRIYSRIGTGTPTLIGDLTAAATGPLAWRSFDVPVDHASDPNLRVRFETYAAAPLTGTDEQYQEAYFIRGSLLSVPGKPTGLGAVAKDKKAVLTWSSNPTADNVTSWQLIRNSVVVQSNLPAGTLTVTDSGLTNGTTYTYQIAAVNANGVGPASDPVTVTPTAVLVVTPTSLSFAGPTNTTLPTQTLSVSSGGIGGLQTYTVTITLT